LLFTLRDSGSLAGCVQRQDRRAWQLPALVDSMLDLGTEARSCSPILVLTGRERGSCNGYTNDPRNIRPISGRPLALRRWSSAKNGERDGSGHPVACAYRGQGRALQAPRALALLAPHSPPSARTPPDSPSTHRYSQDKHAWCTSRVSKTCAAAAHQEAAASSKQHAAVIALGTFPQTGATTEKARRVM
jgi:hypothetical protein